MYSAEELSDNIQLISLKIRRLAVEEYREGMEDGFALANKKYESAVGSTTIVKEAEGEGGRCERCNGYYPKGLIKLKPSFCPWCGRRILKENEV